MNEHKFIGEHVIAELYNVDKTKIFDNSLILDILSCGINKSGATCETIVKKEFDPQGFSAIALLSESHASLHTYPEKKAMFMDAFTCGNTCYPYIIIQEMIKRLGAEETNIKIIQRGKYEL
ncbi:MAG: adenosylmethionine decarboxylase [Clostridia bacterium]|nr:adenosylmethionine decarboxylase [Clostridia bacterium]